MDFPLYWQKRDRSPFDGDSVAWFSTGGSHIEARLTVRGNLVEFTFLDYGRKDCRRREFSSATRAKNWAIRFGRLMRKLDKEDRVPLPWKFEKF